MLADRSISRVTTGFPAGGGIGSDQVGFRRIQKSAASPAAAKVVTIIQERMEIAGGRRKACHPSMTAEISANATHRDEEINGSNTIVPSIVVFHVRNHFSAPSS